MRKKFLPALLALVMVLSLLPVSAFAAAVPAPRWGSDVVIANMADTAADHTIDKDKIAPDAEITGITAVAGVEDFINAAYKVDIRATGLKLHQNDKTAGNGINAYWIGIGVPFVSGYHYIPIKGDSVDDLKDIDLDALKEDLAGEGETEGVTADANAGMTAKKDNKYVMRYFNASTVKYAAVAVLDGTKGAVALYIVDLSEVTVEKPSGMKLYFEADKSNVDGGVANAVDNTMWMVLDAPNGTNHAYIKVTDPSGDTAYLVARGGRYSLWAWSFEDQAAEDLEAPEVGEYRVEYVPMKFTPLGNPGDEWDSEKNPGNTYVPAADDAMSRLVGWLDSGENNANFEASRLQGGTVLSGTISLGSVTVARGEASSAVTEGTTFYTVGTEAKLPDAPTKDGENFTGWEVDDGANKTVLSTDATEFKVAEARAYTLTPTFKRTLTGNDISLAPMVDAGKEDPIDKDKLAAGAGVKAVTADGGQTFTVKVTASDVRFHENGNHDGGYWVGVAVKAPEGAEGVAGSWHNGEKQITELEPAVDGENADTRGCAFYYDLSTGIRKDEIKIRFTGEDGAELTEEAAISVDLSGVTTDSMDFEEVGFTYNRDTGVVADCIAETMYWQFPAGKKVDEGKYVVTVSGPNGYWDFFVTPAESGKTRQAFSFLNKSQTTPAEGAEAGVYTIQLYTYTGKRLTGSDRFTAGANGAPVVEGRTFMRLGTARTVEIVDLDKAAVTAEASAAEGSNAIIDVEAAVSGDTITLTGSAANMSRTGEVTVTLKPSTAVDKSMDDITVTLEKNGDGTALAVKSPETYRLLAAGTEYKIVADISIARVDIVAGPPTVDNPNHVSDTVVNEVKKSDAAEGDTALGEAAAEAAVGIDPMGDEDKKAALEAAGVEVLESATLYEVIEPRLNIVIDHYNAANKTLELDISAVYDVIITTEDPAGSPEFKFEDEEGANSTRALKDQPLPVNDPIRLTIGLPAGFAEKDTSLYIRHTKNGSVHCHKGTVAESGGDIAVAFTSADGLSPFVISAEADVEAGIGDTYYETLAEAVAAVKDGETVKLEKNVTLTGDITVNRAVSFTLEKGSYSMTGGEIAAGTGYTLTQTGDNYTFTARSAPGAGPSGPAPAVTVNTETAVNGTFTVSGRTARAGDTVTVTPKADEGYAVGAVTVTDRNGDTVPVTAAEDGTYTFVMPERSRLPVTVSVTFDCDGGDKCVSRPYSDVDTGQWYHKAVDYVIAHGLMKGTGETTFEPGKNLDRASLVTVLYRLEREPAVDDIELAFTDVAAGAWYADAVKWAAANGIVKGTGDTTFEPAADLTREQAAVILYRYAAYRKLDVTGADDLAAFTDAGSVSDWAADGVKWAVGVALINGETKDDTVLLDPAGACRRAMVAKIMMQFCEEVAK